MNERNENISDTPVDQTLHVGSPSRTESPDLFARNNENRNAILPIGEYRLTLEPRAENLQRSSSLLSETPAEDEQPSSSASSTVRRLCSFFPDIQRFSAISHNNSSSNQIIAISGNGGPPNVQRINLINPREPSAEIGIRSSLVPLVRENVNNIPIFLRHHNAQDILSLLPNINDFTVNQSVYKNVYRSFNSQNETIAVAILYIPGQLVPRQIIDVTCAHFRVEFLLGIPVDHCRPVHVEYVTDCFRRFFRYLRRRREIENRSHQRTHEPGRRNSTNSRPSIPRNQELTRNMVSYSRTSPYQRLRITSYSPRLFSPGIFSREPLLTRYASRNYSNRRFTIHNWNDANTRRRNTTVNRNSRRGLNRRLNRNRITTPSNTLIRNRALQNARSLQQIVNARARGVLSRLLNRPTTDSSDPVNRIPTSEISHLRSATSESESRPLPGTTEVPVDYTTRHSQRFENIMSHLSNYPFQNFNLSNDRNGSMFEAVMAKLSEENRQTIEYSPYISRFLRPRPPMVLSQNGELPGQEATTSSTFSSVLDMQYAAVTTLIRFWTILINRNQNTQSHNPYDASIEDSSNNSQ